MIDGIADWLRAQFDEDEERLRSGWYGDTHWGMLRTRLVLGAWTVSRVNGVASQLNDQIADAGLGFMRELFDQWQAAHAAPRLAEIAAKREILFLHHRMNPGNCLRCYEWIGPKNTNERYPCKTVRALAAPYAGRPGWLGEWAA